MCDIYVLTIPHSDIVKLELGSVDRLLLDECENSGRISDNLLGLAMLARRKEEYETKRGFLLLR